VGLASVSIVAPRLKRHRPSDTWPSVRAPQPDEID
jgi:hypothetical protein